MSSRGLAHGYLEAVEAVTPEGTKPEDCINGVTAMLASLIVGMCPLAGRGEAVEIACAQLTELVSAATAMGH
jgi:hypothetical protein